MTANPITIERFLSCEQVAEALGIHPRTVKRLIRCGAMTGVRVGAQYRVSEAEFRSFVERSRVIAEAGREAIDAEVREKSEA